jgi:hypothetical protein
MRGIFTALGIAGVTAAALLASPAGASSPTRTTSGPTPSTPTCRPATTATVTTATIRRYDPRRIAARGEVSAWTPTGWRPLPPADYLLTLQKLVGSTWTYVTRIKPRTSTYVFGAAGTYRLAFPGVCDQPAAPSVSKNVVVPAAALKPKAYRNCAALHVDYPHGVAARVGVKDKVRGRTKPVTDYVVSKKVYDLNKRKLDADRDLIVCEKL